MEGTSTSLDHKWSGAQRIRAVKMRPGSPVATIPWDGGRLQCLSLQVVRAAQNRRSALRIPPLKRPQQRAQNRMVRRPTPPIRKTI